MKSRKSILAGLAMAFASASAFGALNDCVENLVTNRGCTVPARVTYTNIVLTPMAPAGAPYASIACVCSSITARVQYNVTNSLEVTTYEGRCPTNWTIYSTNHFAPIRVTNLITWATSSTNKDEVTITSGNAGSGDFTFTGNGAPMPTDSACSQAVFPNSPMARSYAFVGVGSLAREPEGNSLDVGRYAYCKVSTNAVPRYVIVTASPDPAMDEQYLPSGWEMTGGLQVTNADGSVKRDQRRVDLASAGTNMIVAKSGCSSLTNLLIVEGPVLTLGRTNVFVNQDDDNTNGVPDMAEFNGELGLVVTNENDLRLMTLKVESPARTNETVTLSVWPIWWPYGHVRVWDSPQRGTNPPVLDNWTSQYSTNWTVSTMPTNLWVEGVDESMDLNDVTFTLQTEFGCEVSQSLTVWSFALDGDGDHDGAVARGGEDHRLKNKPWGVIVPTNVDDDDTNHVADIDDSKINGPDDLNDLAPVVLRRLPWTDASNSVVLTLHSPANADGAATTNIVRVFSSNSDTNAVQILGPGADTYTLTASNLTDLRNGDLTFGVEGLKFAGEVRLKAVLKDGSGTEMARDEILLKASPFILLPGTASAQIFYVLDWDTNSVTALEAAVGSSKVTNVSSASYPDVWVQDEVEIGFTRWPGGEMHVVWNLPRNGYLDSWPTNELLAPGYGNFDYGTGGPKAAEFGGNMEVTPPVTVGTNEYKFGRAVGGSNMHASLRGFIERQGVQTNLIQLDVSWLYVEHVDEVVSFVSDGSGFKVLIADTTRAMNLLRTLNVETNGTSTGGNTTTLVDTNMNWPADFWKDGFITNRSGINAGLVRQIAGNTANTITIQGAWPSATGTNSQYHLVARSAYLCMFIEGDEDLGVVSASTGTTLTDSNKTWSANQWTNNSWVYIVEGSGSGQSNGITSNTSNRLTLASTWATIPNATSRYVIGERSKMWDTGRPAMDVVRRFLSDASFTNYQADCQAEIDGVRNTLTNALQLAEADFIRIPALFFGGVDTADAYVPGMVNLLVDGNTLAVAKPFGPRQGGVDVFEADVESSLGAYNGRWLYFIDDWNTYHRKKGEVHCGTNAKRAPAAGVNWWSSP